MRNFKKLWNLLKGCRTLYFSAMGATIIASFLMFVGPYIIRLTIDSIIGNKVISAPKVVHNVISIIGGKSILVNNLWICGLFILIFSVLEGIFMYFKGKWSAQASESMAEKLEKDLDSHLSFLPYDYFVKAKTGDLVQRCSSDVETIRSFFAVQFVEVGRTLAIISIATFLMLNLNIKLTFAAMLFIPVILTFSYLYFQKIRKQFKVCDEAEGEVSTLIQENLSGIRVVRAFAKEKFELDKFTKKNKKYLGEVGKLINMFAWYWSISDFFSFLQVILLLISSTYFVINKEITLGTMIQFIQYQWILLWPIRQLGRILTEMGKALVAVERVQEILDVPIEKFSTETNLEKIEGDIIFSNVSFSYDNKNDVLHNLSFKVKKGETIAILGATGSGKSSLVHLLPRLYDYQKGSIKIGGIELNTIDKRWIRENIAIVLQEPFMFSKSIIDNMNLANKKANEADIFEAARVASIHDVINDFDKGYETAVGEKGVTLSGGQKQRLAIARALLKDTPILIFDDSLSAVDTETDKKIRAALNARNENTTTIIISHRISTLAEADRILILEKGRITQQGTHNDLIKVDGVYKKIWNIQNKLDDDIKHELDGDINKIELAL